MPKITYVDSNKITNRNRQPSAQHVWISWAERPKLKHSEMIDVFGIRTGTHGRGDEIPHPEGFWISPNDLQRIPLSERNRLSSYFTNQPQVQQQTPGRSGLPVPPGYKPTQTGQPQPFTNPNLIDRPIPSGGQSPLQPNPLQQAALNLRPGVMNRQELIDVIRKTLPQQSGESDKAYADRINEQLRHNPFLQELLKKQQFGGPVTAEEMAGPQSQQQRYEQLRREEALKEQRRKENFEPPNPFNLPQNPPGSYQAAVDELVRQNPYQRGMSNDDYIALLNKKAQDQNNNGNPFNNLPKNLRRPITLKDVGLDLPPAKETTTSSSTDKSPKGKGGGGGKPEPQPQPGSTQVAENPAMNADIERMNALLGQIKRTNRRATPNELNQIRNLYGAVNEEIQRGNGVPQNLVEPLGRIRRDFNDQARLLNVNGLEIAGAPTVEQQQQQLNQQLAQQGRLPGIPMNGNRINYEPIAQQFPNFFVQNKEGQIVRDGQGNPILRTEDRVEKNDLPMYRKIRSDINHVLEANHDQNLEGLGNANPSTNTTDAAGLRRRFLEQDADYRNSPEYRNVQIPQKGPLFEATRSNFASAQRPAQELPGQKAPAQQPQAQQQAPAQQQTQNRPDWVQFLATLGGPTTLAFYQLYNQMRRQKGQEPVPAPDPNNPNAVPAINDPAIQQTRSNELRDFLFGGGHQIHQIPIMTRDQINLMNQLGTLSGESLQQASQPLNYFPQQQQQANTSLGSILQRLQNGDYTGAQQELTLAGGAANMTQIANQPGLQALATPQTLNPQQQTQFSQLFGNQLPAQQAQPQQQPMDTQNQYALVNQLGGIGMGGMERQTWDQLTPDQQNQAAQIVQQLSAIPNPINAVKSMLNRTLQIYPQLAQYSAQQQPPAQQNLPPYQNIIPPQVGGQFLPQGQQPFTFGAPGPGGITGQQPAQNIFGRGQQILGQGQNALGGLQQGQQGLQQMGQGGSQFGSAFKQLGQGNFMNALDLALNAGKNLGTGLNTTMGGAQQTLGAGNNALNLLRRQPTQPAPGQPGMPGGNPPVGPGGGGGGGLPQPGGFGGMAYGYPHTLPATATNEINRFYNQTVPSLAERFTAMGGGQRSAAFQGALGSAGRDLGLGLQALNEQNVPNQLATQQQLYNQQAADRAFNVNQQRYLNEQQQMEREYSRMHGMAMLPYALGQQTTPAIIPSTAGIVPALGNIGGQIARGFVGGGFG